MKCFREPRACLWPKSANGNVEIPFLISEKYGRLELDSVYYTCLFDIHDVTDEVTFIHDCRPGREEYHFNCHEGLCIQNLHSLHSTYNSEEAHKH